MAFLLERLAQAGDHHGAIPVRSDVRGAIAAQIQRIVACRPRSGGGSALLDFGMPSPVDVARGGEEGLSGYASRLARLIGDNEPRLRDVSVILATDEGSVGGRLVVSGILADAGEEQPFRLELGER